MCVHDSLMCSSIFYVLCTILLKFSYSLFDWFFLLLFQQIDQPCGFFCFLPACSYCSSPSSFSRLCLFAFALQARRQQQSANTAKILIPRSLLVAACRASGDALWISPDLHLHSSCSHAIVDLDDILPLIANCDLFG